jgi:hypothetical protein
MPLSSVKNISHVGTLVEIEHLDRLDKIPIKAPPLRLNDDEKILAMLLPS